MKLMLKEILKYKILNDVYWTCRDSYISETK